MENKDFHFSTFFLYTTPSTFPKPFKLTSFSKMENAITFEHIFKILNTFLENENFFHFLRKLEMEKFPQLNTPLVILLEVTQLYDVLYLDVLSVAIQTDRVVK